VKASKGDYVTLSTDLTSFDPVINFIPGSMSPNASGESGHKLVSAYLLQADPLTKITTKIKQLLVNLDTESSQWELDQELNAGTKDYKITLKHRFDTSITSMQDVEVYPFKPSAKLYHVKDETITNGTKGNGWVKATCGGEEVFDIWTGKESNEAYLIDNEEKEKIISSVLSFIIEYYYTINPYSNRFEAASSQKFIANTECAYGVTGGSYRDINLQSDEYYLETYLNYVRNDGEYWGINRYPNVSGNIMQTLQCVINSKGAKLEDFSSVKRETENRYIIENYRNDQTRYVLEQKYSMVPN
jgi:hypothetical protein